MLGGSSGEALGWAGRRGERGTGDPSEEWPFLLTPARPQPQLVPRWLEEGAAAGSQGSGEPRVPGTGHRAGLLSLQLTEAGEPSSRASRQDFGASRRCSGWSESRADMAHLRGFANQVRGASGPRACVSSVHVRLTRTAGCRV